MLAERDGRLTIGVAFSRVFKRAYSTVDPEMEMLPAISLLRFHEKDTLPIQPDKNTSKPRAITGYSILAKLTSLGDQRSLRAFLRRPCTDATVELSSLRANESLQKLFQAYTESRFGYAMVEAGGPVGFVNLSDTLGLYVTGEIASDLSVGDVASQIYQVPGEMSLSQVLASMFARSIRRIFVNGGDAFVSDQSIIGQIFSSDFLNSMLRDSRDVLQMPMNEMEKVNPERVDANTSIRAAALRLKDKRDQVPRLREGGRHPLGPPNEALGCECTCGEGIGPLMTESERSFPKEPSSRGRLKARSYYD